MLVNAPHNLVSFPTLLGKSFYYMLQYGPRCRAVLRNRPAVLLNRKGTKKLLGGDFFGARKTARQYEFAPPHHLGTQGNPTLSSQIYCGCM